MDRSSCVERTVSWSGSTSFDRFIGVVKRGSSEDKGARVELWVTSLPNVEVVDAYDQIQSSEGRVAEIGRRM